MSHHQSDHDSGPLDLPASMADIFLALVAVVILMLLSLLPAIRTPGGLASPQAAELNWSNVVIEGKTPALYVAADTNILVVENDARIGLDEILRNRDLSEGLRAAAQSGNILLVIQPEGQESAFLFSSLAGSLGVDHFYQLRIDAGCTYVRDAVLARSCRGARPRVIGP
ncbi:hypothetical protein [Mesorhizobium sp. ANAO-SY3R2]|uniref:hypothetical protein n=1 Tax=Mesorhizobium sp. ANAO-SY3R2 TaxID=3166644 RepID=UPI00366C387F